MEVGEKLVEKFRVGKKIRLWSKHKIDGFTTCVYWVKPLVKVITRSCLERWSESVGSGTHPVHFIPAHLGYLRVVQTLAFRFVLAL